ncbi:hypothetical protein V1264_019745 [Littorina saxatilis]|uniref:Proton-coupled folate transporter n=2 Tax=Littorina saxatilis TaxID=31220 RepID=A0AAN9BKW5_9CAEN
MQLDLVSGGLSIVVNLFLGSYSDVLGRRFVLLVPIVGHFLRNATAPVVIHWNLGASYLYVGYVIDGLCGGASGVALGLYVYTADITSSDKSRTVGMAVVDTATGLTGALAYLGAGYFIEYTGFFYPSLVSAIFLLMSALVILCLLPETVPRDRKGWFSPAEGARRVFSIFLSRGQKYQRAFLWMGLLAFFLAMMPEFADVKVRSLYLMNEPFCWSSVQMGIFQAAKDGASRCSSLFLIKVLQRCLLTPALAIIAATAYVAGDVLMAFARDDLAVFMVPVVSMAGYMVFAAIRSMMSRLVPPDKQGALFAAIAVVESACYCMGQTTFFSIYQATMHVFQGVIFFFFAGFHFFIIVIYVIYLCLFRRVVPSQVAPISVQTEDIPDS